MKWCDVGFVSGYFHIVHEGHRRLLSSAKQHSKKLVVGVYSVENSHLHSASTLEERVSRLRMLSFVDEVVVVHDLLSLIKTLKPDIIFKGREFENAKNIEKAAVEAYGGKLLFASGGENSFSDFDQQAAPMKSITSLPKDYLDRRSINMEGWVERLRGVRGCKVVLLGEVIVDEYVDCTPVGLSREDGCVVNKFQGMKRYVGGSGVVALHFANLGAQVSLYTSLGDDEPGLYAIQLLEEHGVTVRNFGDFTSNTIVKTRYRFDQRSIFRLSTLAEGSLSQLKQLEIVREISEVVSDSDLLVFSDFNYGLLPDSLTSSVIVKAKEHGLMIIADSQASSQPGGLGKYRAVNLVVPTEFEIREMLGNQQSGINELCRLAHLRLNVPLIIMTLGAKGVFLSRASKDFTSFETDEISSLCTDPQDVSGAGDSLLALAGLGCVAGLDFWEIAAWGSIGAGIQVSRVGNLSLSYSDLDGFDRLPSRN